MTPAPRDQDLEPWMLGLLAGGERGAVGAAIAALFTRGIVRLVSDSVFRVGTRAGLTGFEAAVFDASEPGGSTVKQTTARAREAVKQLILTARERRLIRRVPFLWLTSSGKVALAWHRERAQPLLDRGRASGLMSMHPRDAALAFALFAPLKTEQRWADPRRVEAIPETASQTRDWSTAPEFAWDPDFKRKIRTD